MVLVDCTDLSRARTTSSMKASAVHYLLLGSSVTSYSVAFEGSVTALLWSLCVLQSLFCSGDLFNLRLGWDFTFFIYINCCSITTVHKFVF